MQAIKNNIGHIFDIFSLNLISREIQIYKILMNISD